MSEKEIIFNIKNAIEEAKKKYNDTYNVSMTLYLNKLIEGLLDLYNKEKEINADLVKTRIEDLQKLYKIQQEDYISKDKIRERIKELEEQMKQDEVDEFGIHSISWSALDYVVEQLKELLEE